MAYFFSIFLLVFYLFTFSPSGGASPDRSDGGLLSFAGVFCFGVSGRFRFGIGLGRLGGLHGIDSTI